MDARKIFEQHIISRFPDGIFYPVEETPNLAICSWLYSSVKEFFSHNSQALKIEIPLFYLIQSDSINACAFSSDGYNFIGITKGTIDYSAFIFRDLLLDNEFLAKTLGLNHDQNSVIINNEEFSSWSTFCRINNLSFHSFDYNPNNTNRRIIAEALAQYFVFFIILHEVGHLRQKNSNYVFESDVISKSEAINLIRQVYEMDADKFAVNQFAIHLMTVFRDRELPINQPYSIFFQSEEMVIRYSLFMLFFMFYLFAHRNRFEKYILKHPHPHPGLRLNYSSRLLAQVFYENSFQSEAKLELYFRQSIHDFGHALQKVFPNSGLIRYFNSIKDVDLNKHYAFLKTTAKTIKNLNGQY